jgi:hypothetical protein
MMFEHGSNEKTQETLPDFWRWKVDVNTPGSSKALGFARVKAQG